MFKTFLTRFIKDERGVTAIEYGVIGVALAVGLALVFGDVDSSGAGSGFIKTLWDAFSKIASNMS
ncbi:Flp family type IVb pilin [Vibrio sp. B1Z05]|uniref:Flp family type IVb pilin n=1 Tax=Vibrio sp. B1Z05 TaxID=2654980 RepID=UPI00128DD837|nr:Flp family type IVb pilin [Vibrio sp. B1Z05]MPW35372.1 Flp family type IVb pilin [Vibrio sp. B1Z05]